MFDFSFGRLLYVGCRDVAQVAMSSQRTQYGALKYSYPWAFERLLYTLDNTPDLTQPAKQAPEPDELTKELQRRVLKRLRRSKSQPEPCAAKGV